MQKLMQLKNKKGFTLIEMLIVILIVVILIAIAVPAVNSYREDAAATADEGAAKTMYTALEAALTEFEYLAYGTGNTDYTFLYPVTGNNDMLTTSQVMDPTAGYSAAYVARAISLAGGHDFPGKFKFGYSISDNSISWVSYHDSDNTTVGGNGRTAANNRVYIYDVVNNVSGYADDLGSPYTDAGSPYLHTY